MVIGFSLGSYFSEIQHEIESNREQLETAMILYTNIRIFLTLKTPRYRISLGDIHLGTHIYITVSLANYASRSIVFNFTTICKLADLIPAPHQSDCKIPN